MLLLWSGNDVTVTGLSHEQLLSLRTIVKESGTGVQGHSRATEEKAVALLTVNTLMQELDLSFDAAVKIVAKSHLASPSTLRRASITFTETGTLPIPSTAHRGRGNPNHPLHFPSEPTFDIEIAIHRIMYDQVAMKARHIALKHIQQQLLEEYQTHVGKFTLARWMEELGYAWGEKNFIGALKPLYQDFLNTRETYRS
jgi:hypothetical protein